VIPLLCNNDYCLPQYFFFSFPSGSPVPSVIVSSGFVPAIFHYNTTLTFLEGGTVFPHKTTHFFSIITLGGPDFEGFFSCLTPPNPLTNTFELSTPSLISSIFCFCWFFGGGFFLFFCFFFFSWVLGGLGHFIPPWVGGGFLVFFFWRGFFPSQFFVCTGIEICCPFHPSLPKAQLHNPLRTSMAGVGWF